jgi:acyl carrier protein
METNIMDGILEQGALEGPETAALGALMGEIAELLVEGLNLGVQPGAIDPDGAIFGEGLGLDSIDALEIALLVQRKYGVSITQGEEQNKQIFRSLRSLTEFVAKNRSH